MFGGSEENVYLCTRKTENPGALFYMVPVVQLVRASDCGSECRRFESVRAPFESLVSQQLTRHFLLFFRLAINLILT